jgi:hypothetical protein
MTDLSSKNQCRRPAIVFSENVGWMENDTASVNNFQKRVNAAAHSL